MRQLKAVVLEKKGPLVTILASDGSFQKVRYHKPVEVGAEIEIAEARQRQPFWRVAVSIAAVFLIALIGSMSWNFYQATTAVAMISVDINPRLQLTLDKKGRVLQSESLNPDAERVLAGLPLKGEPWNQALSEIIKQSVTLHYLNPNHTWVLVGYSPVKAGSAAPDGVNPDDIAKKIESAAQALGMEPKIAVYQLSAEEQRKAQDSGLTLGEYALMNTAQEVGIQADANIVKNTDGRVKLLEQPQVLKQMNKENRIMGRVLKDNGTPAENNNQDNSQSNSNSQNNDTDTNTGKKSGKAGNKPQSGVSRASGASQGNVKQEIWQGQPEQDKVDGKEIGNQGKLAKSKNEEDNTQSGSSQKSDQRSANTSDSMKILKNFGMFFQIFGSRD